MLVKKWMSTPVITIDADDSMSDAIERMKAHDIRMLPVIQAGKLAGIITDRDLKRASASDATTLEFHELVYLLSKVKVKEIMTRSPITVSPEFTVEETADLLLKNKISGAPVVDRKGKLAGVITQADLFKVILSLTGRPGQGIQFALRLKNRPGAIQDIIATFREFDGRTLNILASVESAAGKETMDVYFKMYGLDRDRLPELKEALNTKGELLYMVDYYENKREIYV